MGDLEDDNVDVKDDTSVVANDDCLDKLCSDAEEDPVSEGDKDGSDADDAEDNEDTFFNSTS